MTVDPFRKRSLNLLVGKQPVLFVSSVESGPQKGSNLKLHSRTRLDSAGLSNHPQRGKTRTQESQGVFPFMETKYGFHRRFDEDALKKSGHALSPCFGP